MEPGEASSVLPLDGVQARSSREPSPQPRTNELPGRPLTASAAATLPRPSSPGWSPRSWLPLLLAGLLGAGSGTAAGRWLPAPAHTPRVLQLSAGTVARHQGWTIRLLGKQLRRGAAGRHLLLRLELSSQGAVSNSGRHFFLDVGQVSRLPAFWSAGPRGALTLVFSMTGPRQVAPMLRFWPPDAGPLVMEL